MDRLELIEKLLDECGTTADIVTGFLEKPRKYAADDALYMREAHFVVALGRSGSRSMSEMAQLLNVTPGAASQIAARLEKKGYVTRARALEDRRQISVSLTEKGKLLCQEHIAFDHDSHRFVSEFLEEFSDEDLEKFIRYEQLIQELFKMRK